MANPLELLAELRDRLGGLPDQVAQMVKMSLSTPVHAEDGHAPFLAAEEAIGPLMQMLQGAPGAPQLPGGLGGAPAPEAFEPTPYDAPPAPPAFEPAAVEPPAPPAPGEPQDFAAPPAPEAFEMAPPEPPQAPAFGQAEPAAAPPSPDYSSYGDSSPPAPAAPDYEPPSYGGDRQDDMMALLQSIDARLDGQGGGGGALPFRAPQPPQRIPLVSVWEAPQEAYGGGAAPSMPYSNLAGAGGASTRQGYGTHGGGGRYWQPEDEGVPR